MLLYLYVYSIYIYVCSLIKERRKNKRKKRNSVEDERKIASNLKKRAFNPHVQFHNSLYCPTFSQGSAGKKKKRKRRGDHFPEFFE